MNSLPLHVREDRFKAANEYRDEKGQAHFPDDKLSAGEMDKPAKKRGAR